jgi:hypothetical protein
MSVMTKEGFGVLRFAYLVLIAGIGVAVFISVGGYLYWQAEKKNLQLSQRGLNDAQSRLANAKREREDLRNSEDTYKALTNRGVFVAERRLDLYDALEALKLRHKITTLEYEIGPQRPLKLAGGAAITAVDAMGSRIQMKVSAVHDGELVAFLDEFSRMQRGLFPMDRCIIRRQPGVAVSAAGSPPAGNVAVAAQTTTPNAAARADDDGDESGTANTPITQLRATLEAECAIEWITLVDKRAPPATSAAANAAATPNPQKSGKL